MVDFTKSFLPNIQICCINTLDVKVRPPCKQSKCAEPTNKRLSAEHCAKIVGWSRSKEKFECVSRPPTRKILFLHKNGFNLLRLLRYGTLLPTFNVSISSAKLHACDKRIVMRRASANSIEVRNEGSDSSPFLRLRILRSGRRQNATTRIKRDREENRDSNSYSASTFCVWKICCVSVGYGHCKDD